MEYNNTKYFMQNQWFNYLYPRIIIKNILFKITDLILYTLGSIV